jgi:hypothetical protein
MLVLSVADKLVMFYDLNVPWTDATRELQRTVVFLDECELLRALTCGWMRG